MGWGFDLEILALARRMWLHHRDVSGLTTGVTPKVAGLVGDSAAKAALQVFRDLS